MSALIGLYLDSCQDIRSASIFTAFIHARQWLLISLRTIVCAAWQLAVHDPIGFHSSLVVRSHWRRQSTASRSIAAATVSNVDSRCNWYNIPQDKPFLVHLHSSIYWLILNRIESRLLTVINAAWTKCSSWTDYSYSVQTMCSEDNHSWWRSSSL